MRDESGGLLNEGRYKPLLDFACREKLTYLSEKVVGFYMSEPRADPPNNFFVEGYEKMDHSLMISSVNGSSEWR